MNTLTIKTNKTIVEHVKTTTFQREYVIKKDTACTVVLIAKHSAEIDICIRLDGAGSSAQICGFVVGDNDSKISLKTLQLHASPNTTSNLLVKSVLSDASQFLYDGGIEVVKHAQKTDAYQRNENILLSKNARAESKPKLEILANDVRCTHGATTGMLSENELWYLQTRGIDKEAGKSLLIQGFFEHAISQISDTMGQQKVRDILWQTL